MNNTRNSGDLIKKTSTFQEYNIYYSKTSQDKLILTLRSFLLFCIIFSASIFLDILLLPNKTVCTKINDVYFVLDGNKIKSDKIRYINFTENKNDLICRVETNEKTFSVSPDYYTCFSMSEKIQLHKTYLMKFLIKASGTSCNNIKPYINIKSWFILLPVALFIFGVIGLRFKNTDRLITFAALNIILMGIFFFLLVLY